MSNSLHLLWHAVYVKSRYEKKVTEILSKKDIETYCPYNCRQKTDRKKFSVDPLFESLVFLRIVPEQMSLIKSVNGIINFAYWLGKPVVIKDEEINAIKLLVQTKEPLLVQKTKVDFSGTVELLHQRKVEREGKLVQIFHIPFKVTIPSLGYTIVTEAAHNKHVDFVNEDSLTVSTSGKQIFLEQLSKEVG